LFQRESLAFVRRHAEQPFFLYLAFNAPHSASNLEKDSLQVPTDVLKKHYPDADPSDRRTKYMGMVTAMDEAIGELLDELEQRKLRENTLIVFHSDNGGSGAADNTPLQGRKATMWEGGLRVPCIVSWPKQLPAAQVCSEFVTSLDVLPTITAATGAQPSSAKLDGFDMLPVLRGESKSQRSTMFWQRRDDKAARVGHYKWLDSEKGRGLYDLSNDIGEQHDLSDEQPQKLAELEAAFDAWRSEMDASEPRGPFRDYCRPFVVTAFRRSDFGGRVKRSQAR
jgi:arylsulfatase A-like enzyme